MFTRYRMAALMSGLLLAGQAYALGPVVDATAGAQIYMDEIRLELYNYATGAYLGESNPYPGGSNHYTELFAGAYSSPSNWYAEDFDYRYNWTSLHDAFATTDTGAPDFAVANAEATAGLTDMVSTASIGLPAFAGEYNAASASSYRTAAQFFGPTDSPEGDLVRLIVPYSAVVISEPSLIPDDYAYAYTAVYITITSPFLDEPIGFGYYDYNYLDGTDDPDYYQIDDEFDISFKVYEGETVHFELFTEALVGTYAEELPWEHPDRFDENGFIGDPDNTRLVPEPGSIALLAMAGGLLLRRRR